MKGIWNNENDMSVKLLDIAKTERNLLSKNGFSKFGMVCTEDGEELGMCYQKDGSFVFVDYRGEEVKRPLYKFSNADIEWVEGMAFNMKLYNAKKRQSTMLLRYDDEELVYSMCNPSSETYSSIYNYNDGEYYLVCKNGKGIHLSMYCYGVPFFEFIDKHGYLHLTFHTTDEDESVHDNREYAGSPNDVICIKETSELFIDSEIINYKVYKIVSSQEPKCTIVLTDGMDEIYRREECAVFCQVGQYAYVIFEKAQIAYNIDKRKEIQLEGLEEYDNYDVGLDYLIRHRVITKPAEEYLGELTPEGQIVETILKHHESDVFVYDSDLNEVGRLHVIGLFDEVAIKDGKILVGATLDDKSSQYFYYDINVNNEKEFDEEYKSYFSKPY